MAATLKSRFPTIIAELRPKVSSSIKFGAELIAEDAQERVHRDTEDLYHAIHTERTGPAEYAVIAGDDQVFYGHLEEFGTSHSPPHPFLVPAVEAQEENVVALVAAALKGL